MFGQDPAVSRRGVGGFLLGLPAQELLEHGLFRQDELPQAPLVDALDENPDHFSPQRPRGIGNEQEDHVVRHLGQQVLFRPRTSSSTIFSLLPTLASSWSSRSLRASMPRRKAARRELEDLGHHGCPPFVHLVDDVPVGSQLTYRLVFLREKNAQEIHARVLHATYTL